MKKKETKQPDELDFSKSTEWPKNIRQFHLKKGRILIATNKNGEAISIAYIPNQ